MKTNIVQNVLTIIQVGQACFFLEKVVWFQPHAPDKTKTIVQFDGGSSNYILVDATVDQLVELMDRSGRVLPGD